MQKPPRVLIGIATYNEIDNLPKLLPLLAELFPDVDLLIVDDGSPDGTAEWCRTWSQSHPQLRLIERSGKLGVGSAMGIIMQHAMDERYDWLVTLDADLSHDPHELPRLLAAMDKADVVIGSRYVAGGNIVNWPWHRRHASRLTNWFVRRTLGLGVADCSSGYRCYQVAALRKLDLNRPVADGYAFYEEVLWRLQRHGASIREVPITFIDRTSGRSKADWYQALRAIGQLLVLTWKG